MKKVVCYTATKNLYSDLETAVKSLLIYNKIDEVYLMIEDDVFPYYVPKNVKVINASQQTIFKPDNPNMNSKFTYMVMMRAVLTKYFPNLNQILTLDVDTIVQHDITDLWDIDLDGYYLAAVKEPRCSRGGDYYKKDVYVNAGVVMWNLDKLRNDKKDDAIIYELNTNHYPFLEQDVINNLCEGKIYLLDADYNVSDWTVSNPPTHKKEKIKHYAAIRERNQFPLVRYYRNLPWDRIKK